MKITFLSNACAIYESKNYRIISDPWLSDAAFYGSWLHNPPLRTKPTDPIVQHCNAIYISHLHGDHLDPETLKHFRKDIPILTLEEKTGYCPRILKDLGFTDVITLSDGEAIRMGPFEVWMFGPFVKHPHHECQVGNIVDSAILLKDDRHVVLNSNDNTPTVAVAERLRIECPPIDLAQLNWNAAGPFPACFDNLTLLGKRLRHFATLERQLKHMLDVGRSLGAKMVMPFAGEFTLSGELEKMVRYHGACSAEEACQYLEMFGMPALRLAECETFDLAAIPPPPQLESPDIDQSIYDLEGIPLGLLVEARDNLWRAQERFGFKADLNMVINDRFLFNWNFQATCLIDGQDVNEPYLKVKMPTRLLHDLLLRKAHWNNLELAFVVRFERRPDTYLPDIHTLLSYFHVPRPSMV